MIVSSDIGGTFTDYVTLEAGKLTAFKTLTTPDPSHGIIQRFDRQTLAEFSHGTTAAVNAVLERTGGPVVFFTTSGFRDLVLIGRQARTDVYSFVCDMPQVPVAKIVEVSERTDTDGTVVEGVSEDELVLAAKRYAKIGPVAVVGFINSYMNPENEEFAEEALRRYFSMVIPSHKVRREIREYDRFCTAIIEGYCKPIVDKYLNELAQLSRRFYLMQSNGGRTRLPDLRAVNMLMSGPAGGVAATEALCRRLGIENAIAYDMGGTSADVSAIVSGTPLYTDTVHITGIPIKTLAIDIETIGAGGGSIAWIDDGGAFKVGPMSAGAHPGPACYGQGGKEFTVSDANCITGVLGARISGISLNLDRALAASKLLCNTLDLSPIDLSFGVLRIVNNNMVSALKRISIGKGYDPREFSLVAFGGAGPMHACALADALGIKHIIVPQFAGAFSALGIMGAPVRFDHVRTILSPLEDALDIIPRVVKTFQETLHGKIKNRYQDITLHVSLDMRYLGQGHEINVPFCDVDALAHAFHDRHDALYGFNMPDNTIEVVNVKLVAELPVDELELPKHRKHTAKVRGMRDVYPDNSVSVYGRDFHGSCVTGPCMIEDETTTIYVNAYWNAELDLHDILHLRLERD